MPNLINWTLLKEPLNWAVIFVMATVWLLAFHTIMQAFASMSGQDTIAGGPPGSVAAPVPSVGGFTTQGGTVPEPLQTFPQGSNWTETYEAKYAEDNYGINY